MSILLRQFVVFTIAALPCFALAQAEAEQPSFLVQAIPLVAFSLILYFFMLRPQIKKQKSQQEFVQALKKGDRVLTSGGIFGTIEGLTDKYVTLEIADDVKIRVLKNHVAQSVKEA